MSKSSYVAASLVSIGLAFLPNASSAAVIQTSQELLSVCPALSSGTGCAEGATEYLDAAQPSNAQIISLVTSIASTADTPQVPKPICLDAAQGIRILAGGVSNAGQRQQILAIANDLCKGSATAAIPALVGSTFNNGNGYYRLKMLTAEGLYKYSKIVLVSRNYYFEIGTIPNPFSSTISADIILPQDGFVKMILIDSYGKIVFSENRKLFKGLNKSSYRGLESLSSGAYYILFEYNGSQIQKKITKIN